MFVSFQWRHSCLSLLKNRDSFPSMADILLKSLLNGKVAIHQCIRWLENNDNGEKLADYPCERDDFIPFFLNYIHNAVNGNIAWIEAAKARRRFVRQRRNGINKSHTYPPDSPLMEETPPRPSVSPKSNFTPSPRRVTPQKSPLCLGDFLNTRPPAKKDHSERRRRIKPTILTSQSPTTFPNENSFNFSQNSAPISPESDFITTKFESVARKLQSSPKAVEIVEPQPYLVTDRDNIEGLVEIYVKLLHDSTPNIMGELYLLISIVLRQKFDLSQEPPLNSTHNIVYFACKSLARLERVLQILDGTTVKLLLTNERWMKFAPPLLPIRKHNDAVVVEQKSPLKDNVCCFDSDTDNRRNFPSDASFQAFRKQRDLFYEIVRFWDSQHLVAGFDFAVVLGGRVRALLAMQNEPANFAHLARLFKAHLLSAGRNQNGLDEDVEKLNRLQNRCVRKETAIGLDSVPKFTEDEEFFRDFILVGGDLRFNRHLIDGLIREIVDLNEAGFFCGDEDGVDLATRKAYGVNVRSLRILAKFLGFIESLPYSNTDGGQNYSEHLVAVHVKLREISQPNFDVESLVKTAMERHTLILCIPWLTIYLSMLDYVTLRLPYYQRLLNILQHIYRHFHSQCDTNLYLIKFSLSWLFELPHMPQSRDQQHEVSPNQERVMVKMDNSDIIDTPTLYICCPFLHELRKILAIGDNPMTLRHITPITAHQSSRTATNRKLEQQLEEAFFNGQPISLRKTVDFVSERVTSTCVKYICSELVMKHKLIARRKLSDVINMASEYDDVKALYKVKSHQLAVECLDELYACCDAEIQQICHEKIPKSIDALVALDILPQTKDVTITITNRICIERIKQWMALHVKLNIFTKELHDEFGKILTAKRKDIKPVFLLPSGGNKLHHNEERTSAVHFVERLQDLSVGIVEGRFRGITGFGDLLSDILLSLKERCDVDQCILASLCTSLLDLCYLLLTHCDSVLWQDGVLSKLCQIWRLYHNEGDVLFKSLLCSRNVMIFAQSKNVVGTWRSFAKFCAYLIQHQMLTCDCFEAQCTGMFRDEWDQETLVLITDFFKVFVDVYKRNGGSSDMFTFLLDFLSDYCGDL